MPLDLTLSPLLRRCLTSLVILSSFNLSLAQTPNQPFYLVAGSQTSRTPSQKTLDAVKRHFASTPDVYVEDDFTCLRQANGITMIDNKSTAIYVLHGLSQDLNLLAQALQKGNSAQPLAVDLTADSTLVQYMAQLFQSDHPASIAELALTPQLQVTLSDPTGASRDFSTKALEPVGLGGKNPVSLPPGGNSTSFNLSFDSRALTIQLLGESRDTEAGMNQALLATGNCSNLKKRRTNSPSIPSSKSCSTTPNSIFPTTSPRS